MIQLVQLSHSVLSRCFSLSRSVTSTLYTFSCTAVLASSPVASGTHAGIHLRPSDIGCQYSRSIYTARLIVWQPRRAADTSTSLFCCCTASMEQATDGAETAVNRRTRFVVIWKHFCFILSTGTSMRIESVTCPRSSGRNTSASVTVTVTLFAMLPSYSVCGVNQRQ